MNARIDQTELFERPIYRDRAGREFWLTMPGRKKRLDAVQAVTLFELQVQIKAAQKQINRILIEAGFKDLKNARSRVLRLNWIDRGRADVIRPNPGTSKAKRP